MKRDRRNGDGGVVRGTDDDGRERDFVDDDRRDCDFGGDIGGCRVLVTGLAVVTDFVIGSVVEDGIEIRGFVGGILCLRLIFVGLVLETEMSVDFVRRRLWVCVSLLTVVNLVQAGLDWR